MITVKQMQRLWNSKAYERLLEQLIAPRPEASSRLVEQLSSHQLNNHAGSLPAAAMVVIRLDELSQSYVPFYSELVRVILNAQRPDGGWGDVIVTALCLRSLMCGQGHGLAIDRGLASLAELQKPERIWPGMPVRRMPIDSFASAFTLMQLNDAEAFRKAVQFEAAVEWFESNEVALDEESRKLWTRAKRRSVTTRRTQVHTRPNTGLAASAASSSSVRSSNSFWDFIAGTGADQLPRLEEFAAATAPLR